MIETITVVAKSELKVSKNKRTYFTIGDEKARTFVCFKPALHPELEIGKAYPLIFTEPTKEGDSYKLDGLATEKEPPEKEVIPPESRRYGRDEERVDQRTFVMEVGADLRAGLIKKDDPLAKARAVILASWVNLETKLLPTIKTTSVIKPKLPPPSVTINAEDLKTQLKDLYKQKKITGKDLFGWGISKWNDIDTLEQDKLAEITERIKEIK